MTPDQAELIAIRALGWLAGQDRLWSAFLAASGAAPQALPRLAGDSVFQAGVLDFLMQSDRAVLAFCAAAGLPPEAPMAARRALPGGAETHWT
jgi:hypothetical protein